MRFFDTHAHYDDDKFKDDLEEVLENVKKANVEKIVNISADFESCKKSEQLATNYDYIYFTIGVHPYEAESFEIDKLEKIYDECKNRKKLVAIGEIGLDYSFEGAPKEAQKSCFLAQIQFAKKHNLPIVVHTRDASSDTYEILKAHTTSKDKVLLHCFCPTEDLVNLVLERENYMVAFGGNITYKRKESFYEYVKRIPLDRILLETDSPYLPPQSKRGLRNDSSNLNLICEKLAEIKDTNADVVAEITYMNALSFYNI